MFMIMSDFYHDELNFIEPEPTPTPEPTPAPTPEPTPGPEPVPSEEAPFAYISETDAQIWANGDELMIKIVPDVEIPLNW